MRLQEARVEAGLERKDVAKAIGIHPSTYALYEMGRSPKIERFRDICNELEVSCDDIIGDY